MRGRAAAFRRCPRPLDRRRRPPPPAARRRGTRRASRRGDPDDARAIAEATRQALLRPGRQRHRRAAAHEPRARAHRVHATGRLHEPRAVDSPPAGAGLGATTPARCSPGPAAPRPRSSSTTAPRPCCWRSPHSRAGAGVAVSRGELVEIGGGFRVPEVMAGVGRAPRRGRHDEPHPHRRLRAGSLPTCELILKVHQSNYRITGFTEDAAVAPLAADRAAGVVDLGSGLLDAACPWLADGPPAWLRDEPAVRQTLEAGAALVVFSGDKLLGGPQAGILAGRADLVDSVRAPSALPRPAARRSRARRAAAGRHRLPPPRRRLAPVLAHGDVGGRRASTVAPRRSVRARSSTARRSPVAARCPASRSRRPASRSTATSRPRCARAEPKPVIARVEDDRDGARPPHGRPGDDDASSPTR